MKTYYLVSVRFESEYQQAIKERAYDLHMSINQYINYAVGKDIASKQNKEDNKDE